MKNLKNRIKKTTYGVGYIGIGKYSTTEHKKFYNKWNSMMQRCYSASYRIKRPTYTNCQVSEIWHNFQNFAKWCDSNYVDGFCLDKDLLVKNNKTYSPETCCFIPNDINILLRKRSSTKKDYPIGVAKNTQGFKAECTVFNTKIYLGNFNTIDEAFNEYKKVKEEEIKRIANVWRYRITEKCYNALMNHKIEISD